MKNNSSIKESRECYKPAKSRKKEVKKEEKKEVKKEETSSNRKFKGLETLKMLEKTL